MIEQELLWAALSFTSPHPTSSKRAQELFLSSIPCHLFVSPLSCSSLEVTAGLGFLKTAFLHTNQSEFSPTLTPGSSGSGCRPHSPETRNKGALLLVGI